MKIVFFGTDNFAAHVLEALMQKHEVLAVVTVPDAPVGRKQIIQKTAVAELADRVGISVFKPASLKKDESIEATLRGLGADVFVVAIYSKIIPQNILNIPTKGSVNVHPSLLPLYRGPAPIRTPLLHGDTVTGVSIILMDEQVDHGPILGSKEVTIEPSDTNTTLTEKLAAVAAPLLVGALDGYAAGTITPQEQDHEKATFTKLVSKEDGKVDWNKSAVEIYNAWRAYDVWPGIYTTWNGKLLKIVNCVVLSSSRMRGSMVGQAADTIEKPGIVLEGGIVTCGQDSYLQITKLQLEGKQAMDIKAFLNGNKDFVGSTLK